MRFVNLQNITVFHIHHNHTKHQSLFRLFIVIYGGPSRVQNLSRTKGFITFIDDRPRLCWVYLLKNKSDAKQTFKNFLSMVKTQFHIPIQTFQTDNGKEYFKNILRKFLEAEGIVHQSRCINTPQQNGVAKIC